MNRAVAAFVTIFTLIATTASADPQGWHLAGNRAQSYIASGDPDRPSSGRSSSLLQSRPGPSPNGFGTLMQTIEVGSYAGKRLRLKADVRTESVLRWAGLWMRVDAESDRTLTFDNMGDRPIVGTRDWRTYEVVLDVPPEGVSISFGVLLAGSGKVWLDNVRFDEVDASVPTTGGNVSSLQPEPSNLDFESQ
jgi:hypothetical protein